MNSENRAWCAGAFIVMAFLIWLFTAPASRRRQPVVTPPDSAIEAYADLIQAFRNDIDSLKRENAELKAALGGLQQRVDNLEKR